MDNDSLYREFEKAKDLALENYMNLKKLSNCAMCEDELFMNAYYNSLCLSEMLVDDYCEVLTLIASNYFDINNLNEMTKRANLISVLITENLKDLMVQTKRIMGVE